jgi:heme/copper-type cytochrome/quinol oxidase subunit 2
MLSSTFSHALFWIAAASCLVAQVAIIRSTIASRRLRAGALDVASDSTPVVARSGFPLEVLWTAIPAVVLAAVLWFTWQKILDRESHSRLDPHPHAVATADGL